MNILSHTLLQAGRRFGLLLCSLNLKPFTLLALLWWSCAFQVVSAPVQAYKVIGVKDGDTIELLVGTNGLLVVRLEHIDCPEKKQPYGQRAKQYVSDLCYGKYVTLRHRGKYDRSKRLIAEVITPNGVNVNQQLVWMGLAWHFKKYSKNKTYAELEVAARERKVGLWSEPYPIPPWEWRKMRKKK